MTDYIDLPLSNVFQFVQLSALTTAERDALDPAVGMVVFNSDTAVLEFYNGTVWGAV